jgi:hypothetical protein
MLQAIQRLSNAPYRILAIAKCDLQALLRASGLWRRPLRRMRPGGARFIAGAVDRMDGSGAAGLRFGVVATEPETAGRCVGFRLPWPVFSSIEFLPKNDRRRPFPLCFAQ